MFEQVPGHPNHVAMAHRNMVRSLYALGRLDEANAELDAATALTKRPSDETSVILLRGEIRRREGKITEALADHGPRSSRTESGELARQLEPLVSLAESNLAAERFAEAATLAERAANIARTVHGAASCRTGEPLRLQADALLALGRRGEALPLAERAEGVLVDAQVDPLARARTDFTLASALQPAERDRALRLATDALTVARRHDAKLASRIEAWLKKP